MPKSGIAAGPHQMSTLLESRSQFFSLRALDLLTPLLLLSLFWPSTTPLSNCKEEKVERYGQPNCRPQTMTSFIHKGFELSFFRDEPKKCGNLRDFS